MNLSILNIKKAQLNAQNSASTATMEAPVKKQVKKSKDYAGVPEAEADAKIAKSKKKSATTARTERKVAQKKAVLPKVTTKPKAEPAAKKEKEPTKKTTPKFQIVNYSEKSIALFGDTKPIKEDLKSLGGRYNANLRPFGEDSRVPGWIFPKKCESAVRELVEL